MLLDVIEVGVIVPDAPDLYVAVTSVVAESPKLIVFEPVLPPTLSNIDVTEFASCFPDVILSDVVLLPSPVAVTVAFIVTVDALDIVVPFDATVPLLTDQEYETLPLLSYPDLHVFVGPLHAQGAVSLAGGTVPQY